ncbi:MAG TPA: mannose-6-phosphate isomerase, class I, partial [Polyangiaceae bacterium]|nr:mannose-6-phosphate isomerase, class I [Polyangiaceae bacterium]
EAELWMGAHPAAPSVALTTSERSLLELTETEPERTLGAAVLREFQGRFPFLLKILAAAEPLSLQAHPTKEQAREGFAREEAAGIPRDAPNRNYRDANHKPELIAALTPFFALVGFREVRATLRLFERLGVEALSPLVRALSEPPEARGLRAFFELAMTAEPKDRARFAHEALGACRRLTATGGEFEKELAWAVRIGEKYPGDSGLVVALALNLVELAPGDAIYLPAGNLHSYLQGTGVEIMASSDNVLRGGLTPKHVDVPELLAVLDFHSAPAELVRVDTNGPELRYRTPAPDFALSRFELSDETAAVRTVSGPEIVVVTHGDATVRRGTESIALKSGDSAFVPAERGDYSLEGTGSVFRARVSDDAGTA